MRFNAIFASAALLPFSLASAQVAPRDDVAATTTQDIGTSPFVQVPGGFVIREAKTLTLDQKYVFESGRVQVVEGPYYHARIFADGGAWNETLLLRALDQQVTALGGARVFDGRLPDAARKMIDEDQPRFVQDLYDPRPYRFRQYLIRAADKRVWIEIGYGYNAEMADLTVLEELAG